MWYNVSSGQLSAWLLSGASVTGYLSLDGTCDSGCQNAGWAPINTDGNQIWWWNHITGEVATWSINDSGHVTFGADLSARCGLNNGCNTSSDAWAPIGIVYLKQPGCTGICAAQKGLLWYRATTGVVSIWLIGNDNVTVEAFVNLPWTCGARDGCLSAGWTMADSGAGARGVVASMDPDGNTDLLWNNFKTHQFSSWLIKDTSGAIKGTQELSSNIPTGYQVVAAAYVNGDNNNDLLLYNSIDGTLVNWFLDGQGGVTGTQTLSGRCGISDSCSTSWHTLGYVSFPTIVR
jgi:hypothetical protein